MVKSAGVVLGREVPWIGLDVRNASRDLVFLFGFMMRSVLVKVKTQAWALIREHEGLV